MFTLALIGYNLLFPLVYLLYFPFYLRKLIRRGNWRRGFWERFAVYAATKKARLRSLQGPVWIHAVSVGETVAALSFIRIWQDRNPKQRFVLSTTTSTGQQVARKKAPDGVEVIYFPMDFLPCVNHALTVINPCQIVLFEVEVWPNLICAASRRNIPVSLVNCRMSDNSSAGYAKHKWFFGRVFGRLSRIAVQTAKDAERVGAVLGSRDQVTVCGTMKFDQVPDRQGEDVNELLDRIFPAERLVFCAASTHAPEEAIMTRVTKHLAASHPEFRIILVPRHQERTAEIEAILQEELIDYVLLTQLRDTVEDPQVRMLVVNTTGELMSFLAASDIVFVGKSLADYGGDGGHNIIEPAIFGKPILHGPAMENFRDVVKIFQEESSALQVADEAEFQTVLERLVSDPGEREAMGRASRQTVEQHRGAVDKTIGLLCQIPRDR